MSAAFMQANLKEHFNRCTLSPGAPPPPLSLPRGSIVCPGLFVLPELTTKKNSTSIHMFVKQRASVPIALVILRTRLRGLFGKGL